MAIGRNFPRRILPMFAAACETVSGGYPKGGFRKGCRRAAKLVRPSFYSRELTDALRGATAATVAALILGMSAAPAVRCGAAYCEDRPKAAEKPSASSAAGVSDRLGGEIRGIIRPPENVRRIMALDRDVRQKPMATHVEIREFPISFDPKTGVYSAANLPPGVYDLYIETSDGWRIEGVDLRPAAEAPGTLDPEDADTVRAHALGMKTFEDEKRCLRIAGNSENAVLLMELVRRGRTSLRDGEPFVVWRMELWFYEKRYGAWTRKEPSKVLRRFRPPSAAFDKWVWLWEPALGGVKVESGAAAVRDYEIPAALEPAMGRYPSAGDVRKTDRKLNMDPGPERRAGTAGDGRPGDAAREEETIVPEGTTDAKP